MAFHGAEDVMVDLYWEQQYEQEFWAASQESLHEEIWAAEEAYLEEDQEWEDFQDFEPLHDEYPF